MLTAQRSTGWRRSYKQINAPLGQFGHDVIHIFNAAVRSTDESRYQALEGESTISPLGETLIAGRHEGAARAGDLWRWCDHEQQAKSLIDQANALLADADRAASSA